MPTVETREPSMTSLDANALVTDAEGMDFLASVLESPTSPTGVFDIAAPRRGWTIAGGESDAGRPCFDARVSEAA